MPFTIISFIFQYFNTFVSIGICLAFAIFMFNFFKPQKISDVNIFLQHQHFDLNKNDLFLLTLKDKFYVKLFIPKSNSKQYKKLQDLYTKVGENEKYKTFELFLLKRAYYTYITTLAVLLITGLPYVINTILKYLHFSQFDLPTFELKHIIMFAFVPILVYYYPVWELTMSANKKQMLLEKEVISLGIFINTMLETGYAPYDVLNHVRIIKPVYKPFIDICLNEYFINPKQALENLKKNIGLPQLDMIVDSLIFAYETNNYYAARFLDEYIKRLEENTKISFEKSNKIKPYILLVASILPLLAALMIWFYPWMIQIQQTFLKGFAY